MASGTLTLKTQSVDYGGGRGAVTMTNTINWSTSGNTLTLSNGGRSGGDYWTLYNSTGAADYKVILKVQVNYGSGWTDIFSREQYIGTVAQGGLRIDTKSDDFLNQLGNYTLSGSCSLRALYYATYAPMPTSGYPNAFPNESYSEASQTSVEVNIAVAPDRPTLSVLSTTSSSITVDWGTTSFGVPTTGTAHLYCQSGAAYPSVGFLVKDVDKKTTTGSSTSTITQFGKTSREDLVPNSQYSLAVWVSNGEKYSQTLSKVLAYTLAEPATVSTGIINETSIQINWSTSADGGFYDKYIDYSLDGGNTWVIGATVTEKTAQNGSFTISNLTPGTSYTIQTRTRTTAGSSEGATLAARTTQDLTHHLYGSKNTSNLAKKIKKFYVSVNRTAKLAKLAYGSKNTSNRAKTIYGKPSGFVATPTEPESPDPE